tara:strand:- start:41 stop:298 length:258 start_codon:yes stop_codon:yes gene_type:complete
MNPADSFQSGGQATTGWKTAHRNGAAFTAPLRLTIEKAALVVRLRHAPVDRRASNPDTPFFDVQGQGAPAPGALSRWLSSATVIL